MRLYKGIYDIMWQTIGGNKVKSGSIQSNLISWHFPTKGTHLEMFQSEQRFRSTTPRAIRATGFLSKDQGPSAVIVIEDGPLDKLYTKPP